MATWVWFSVDNPQKHLPMVPPQEFPNKSLLQVSTYKIFNKWTPECLQHATKELSHCWGVTESISVCWDHMAGLSTQGRASFLSADSLDHILLKHRDHVHCRMLIILQARLQQHVNRELPDIRAGFRKGRGTRDQMANIRIIKKARPFQKNIYFCFIGYAKAFVWITINCGKFWKRWDYQTIWPASWEICMQVRKQQLELDMEKQTGSK